MICASCRVDAFHGTGGDPKIGGKKRSFQPRCRSFFAPRSFRRMSQASQPCAGVISKMGGKWGMSFGEHFKFSISSVHCKVFWRVSNYLFNIGSFLISSVSDEDEEFPSKSTALWQQKHFLLLLSFAKSSFVRLFGCRGKLMLVMPES